MTPTRTIPIARDPKSLQLEADEALMVRMAELQDHLFYNRLVNGMRDRQVQSSSLPVALNRLEDDCQTSFLEKLPSTPHHAPLPVSILISPSRSRRNLHDYHHHDEQDEESRAIKSLSTSPANPLLVMPKDDFTRVQLSSVLTHSLQILEQEEAAEEEELMFEMDF